VTSINANDLDNNLDTIDASPIIHDYVHDSGIIHQDSSRSGDVYVINNDTANDNDNDNDVTNDSAITNDNDITGDNDTTHDNDITHDNDVTHHETVNDAATTSLNPDDLNTLNTSNIQKKREKKRRVRKSKHQETSVVIDEKPVESEIGEKEHSRVTLTYDNTDETENVTQGTQSNIYTLIQEKLNKSSRAKSNISSEARPVSSEARAVSSEARPVSSEARPVPVNVPPMHIIERYISSAESFLGDRWDELDFSQSYTDLNGIIIINEHDESKKNINQVHNNNNRRRKYRGRRQNKEAENL
jgi:hypothetical protein